MREICIETSSMPLRDDKDRQLLLLMFCDSYVELTSDCFVAVDENDRPLGYILCTTDTCRFFRDFRENVLPRIKELGFKYSVTARGMVFLHKMCVIFAPAHLHIDLTESARRKGIGTALMNTLKEYLSEQGINRVQLTRASKNTAAIGFYKKNGFRTVFKGFGSCVMRWKHT
jgi:ribosomal protein S18 acetylase RimI-like enzyme